MAEIFVVRHAEADYPHDRLTQDGQRTAKASRKRFQGFETVTCSPKNRAIQTARAVGYDNPVQDIRLIEYEADVDASSAEEYVLLVHSQNWRDLVAFGDRVLSCIKEYGMEDNALLISHNAAMSAAMRILTGEIIPFPNLGGFKIELQNGNIKNISRI